MACISQTWTDVRWTLAVATAMHMPRVPWAAVRTAGRAHVTRDTPEHWLALMTRRALQVVQVRLLSE